MYRRIQKCNNKTNDYIKKTARMIVNYCIGNDIGTVIVGYNSDFKRNINLGKASFLDNNEMPIFNANDIKENTFSGKRIKRGLYKAKSGRILNADVNGALNTQLG